MTSHPPLDITVIYSDDRADARRVRPKSSAVRAVSPSRVAGGMTLLASAAWLFLVWFPADSYLYMCMMLKSPSFSSELDIGRVLFGGPPPADLAIRQSPTAAQPDDAPTNEPPGEGDVSAFRSPGTTETEQKESIVVYEFASRRKHLPAAVYTWLTVLTITGLAMAAAGGAGLANWITGLEASRLTRLFATLALLAVAIIGWRYWPTGDEARSIPQSGQVILGVCFMLLAVAICASSDSRLAGRLFVFMLVLLALGAWFIWERFNRGFPVMAQRLGILSLMVLAALLGSALARRGPRLYGLAIILVPIAALVTAGGLAYGQSIGGFVNFTPTPEIYGKVLGLHALALVPLVWGRLAAR